MCGPSITGWRFVFCRAGRATKTQVRVFSEDGLAESSLRWGGVMPKWDQHQAPPTGPLHPPTTPARVPQHRQGRAFRRFACHLRQHVGVDARGQHNTRVPQHRLHR